MFILWTVHKSSLLSGGRHYLNIPRLFTLKHPWKDSLEENSQCLCSQDMQKHESSLENYLPILTFHYVSSTVTNIFFPLTDFILRTTLWDGSSHYPHFHEEENEAQRGKYLSTGMWLSGSEAIPQTLCYLAVRMFLEELWVNPFPCVCVCVCVCVCITWSIKRIHIMG